MVVIVACKDSFYIVADNLSIDPKSSTYTLNHQKVFWSEKHKIGLCCAGQANLIGKNSDMSSQDIYTSHVLREFFKYIDDLDSFPVEELHTTLESYVDDKFASYHNYFKFQNPGVQHDNDISYFYGGFKTNAGAKPTVAIYSHHEGSIAQCSFYSPTPYFSNYQERVKFYIDYPLDNSPSPLPDTREKTLISLLDQSKDYLLQTYIPQACMSVDLSYPYTIGKVLHRVVLSRAEVINHRCIEYKGDINNVQYDEAPSLLPSYELYRTIAESMNANAKAWSMKDGNSVNLYDLDKAAAGLSGGAAAASSVFPSSPPFADIDSDVLQPALSPDTVNDLGNVASSPYDSQS